MNIKNHFVDLSYIDRALKAMDEAEKYKKSNVVPLDRFKPRTIYTTDGRGVFDGCYTQLELDLGSLRLDLEALELEDLSRMVLAAMPAPFLEPPRSDEED